MTTGLVIAFMYFIGALAGWCLEFLFRNLISHKGPRGKYFINPGFCRGPYLPIYGIGLTVMFLITYLVTTYLPDASRIVVILGIALAMVTIEFIGGTVLLDVLHMRLWDYRDRWHNYRGIVCPLFTLIWGLIGAAYYLLIHPHTYEWLFWLANHLSFSFFVGLFFGVHIVDWCLSNRDAMLVKEYSEDHDVIVKYDELKALMQQHRLANEQKQKFFNQMGTAEEVNAAILHHKAKGGDEAKVFEQRADDKAASRR